MLAIAILTAVSVLTAPVYDTCPPFSPGKYSCVATDSGKSSTMTLFRGHMEHYDALQIQFHHLPPQNLPCSNEKYSVELCNLDQRRLSPRIAHECESTLGSRVMILTNHSMSSPTTMRTQITTGVRNLFSHEQTQIAEMHIFLERLSGDTVFLRVRSTSLTEDLVASATCSRLQ